MQDPMLTQELAGKEVMMTQVIVVSTLVWYVGGSLVSIGLVATTFLDKVPDPERSHRGRV